MTEKKQPKLLPQLPPRLAPLTKAERRKYEDAVGKQHAINETYARILGEDAEP